MQPKIILIHPPVSKPSEPPAGIAKLAGCLKATGIGYQVIDANLEAILYLLKSSAHENTPDDKWTTRARKNLDANLASIKSIKTYGNYSRYQRTVSDINRLLTEAGKISDVDLSLADYRDRNLTPVKSSDLLQAAEKPELNPFYPYFSLRLSNALKENPEYIGFSLNYLGQALTTFAMIGFIRQINPKQKIVLGGSLTTSWAKLASISDIFSGWVDNIIAGAGEKQLLELLGTEDGGIDHPPYYNDFALDQYFSPTRILPYSTARGCYWHGCSFCPEKAEDNPYQPQLASQVSAQLQLLCEQTNPELIHMLDSAISPALLNVFTKNPPGIPWYGFTRVTPHLTDKKFCEDLRTSGCVMLKLGIESGDQCVLDQLNKGIDLVTVSAALRSLKEAGIATYIYLLFGTPPETEKSALATLDFVIEHRKYIDFLNLAIFNLPVLSPEAQSLSTRSFYEGDLSLYRDFEHPLGWQRAEVRKFLDKTFKTHPAIAKILQRTPDFFTSNHAPFFSFEQSLVIEQ
jgi:hypothetical protein